MDHNFLTLRGAVGAIVLLVASSCASPEGAGPIVRHVVTNHAGVQFVDVDGVRHTLLSDGGATSGATFVFWQPWCKACREEAPAAVAASAELAETMSFYGVVSGPDGAVDEDLFDKSVEELGLSYPQVRDKDLALAKRFGVNKTPTIVVIGSDGHVCYKGAHMPSDWTSFK